MYKKARDRSSKVSRRPVTLLLDHETSRDLGPVLSRDVSYPCLKESHHLQLYQIDTLLSILGPKAVEEGLLLLLQLDQ